MFPLHSVLSTWETQPPTGPGPASSNPAAPHCFPVAPSLASAKGNGIQPGIPFKGDHNINDLTWQQQRWGWGGVGGRVSVIKATRSVQGGGSPRLFSLWGELCSPNVQAQEAYVYVAQAQKPQPRRDITCQPSSHTSQGKGVGNTGHTHCPVTSSSSQKGEPTGLTGVKMSDEVAQCLRARTAFA